MKALANLLVAGVILFSSCKSNPSGQKQAVLTDSLKKASVSDTSIIKDGAIPIFYNMYLSVEMSSLFKSIGASYNQSILNSPEKTNTYNVSTDKALNLGVYAVDLSYAKYFDQFDQAGKYLKAMHQLSTELGIPDDKFMLSIKRIENNLTNKDSLVKIANEIYTATEKYLKDNERESAAAFIVAGGWTEALYIATNLTSTHKNDIELIERIAEQKLSLDNLISLLGKYDKEIPVKEFLSKLFDLKSSFAKLEVNKNNLETTYKQLNEISFKISILRKNIVS
ncbi:MAG TPA: hypothetical protein VIH57_07260 [Bacteroidales bacterium]